MISFAGTSRRADFSMRIIAWLLCLLAVLLYSWNSDDAYHSYIMARHLVEGKGLVYNTGYRVSASTCPLLTLLEAAVFLFTDKVDLCGLLIGLLFSGAAAWVLFFWLCPSPLYCFCLLGLMVSSRCFLSFTTSGLENPLLFLCGAVFFYIYHCNETLSRKQLFILSLLMSLLAMARTDSVLIFIPMVVWAYLVRTKVAFASRVMLGVAGLLPFVFWTIFSIIYYGFPFPNTYYAKLYTGIPVSEYMVRGFWYYLTSWCLDPLLLFVPVLTVVICIKIKCVNRFLVPFFIGLILYYGYVVRIGGDFMAGRHLTQQYFLCLCAIAFVMRKGRNPTPARHNIVAMIELSLIGFLWNIFIAPVVNEGILTINEAINTRRSAVDERFFYLKTPDEYPLWKTVLFGVDCVAFRDSYSQERIASAHEAGDKGLCFGDHEENRGGWPRHKVLFGKDIYCVADYDMYLTDIIALQDPLMVRLKVRDTSNWRVGHIERDVPQGYHETIASGENRITNPSLHEYYDKLLLVMKGPLLNKERFLTIINFNIGRYDELLDQYERIRHIGRD